MRVVLRPAVTNNATNPSNTVIYVLERRSLFDLIVLDLVAEQLEIVNPLSTHCDLEENRRFFFLLRAEGSRGKVTMFRLSQRMQRMQQRLIADAQAQAVLVPVSVFWGRTNEKEGSFARRLVSDKWRGSGGLRRFLGLAFVRTDLLVQLHPPIDWRKQTKVDQSTPYNLRHIARLLRASFKHARIATLGPAMVRRASIIQHLVTRNNLDKNAYRQRRKLAKHLVADLSYPGMRALKSVLDVFWHRVYDQIELLNADRTRDVAKTHTLIYLPNHRSHIDYLILSYLLFMNGISIPHIAAGDNMNLPLIGALLRRCGAFFIRRSFRDDPDYRDLLKRYLTVLLKDGCSIEFFIEGTRSRSGLMLEPRVGLLQMILEIQDKVLDKPIALVPVYVSYERLVESESYRAELLGASKRSENWRDMLNAIKLLRQKLGVVKVALGQPLELVKNTASFSLDQDDAPSMATTIVEKINDTAIFSPTNLVASAVFSLGTGTFPLAHIARRIEFLRGLLRVESLKHAYTLGPEQANSLVMRVGELGFYAIENDEIVVSNRTHAHLAWFRNNTFHAFATASIVAVVILNQAYPCRQIEIVRQVAGLLPHVAGILKFRMDLREVKRWITHFKNANLIQESAENFIEPAEHQTELNTDLRGLAQLIMPVLECMFVSVSCLSSQSPSARTRNGLIELSFKSIRAASITTDDDALLGFERRFFESFIDRLIATKLVDITATGELQSTSKLDLIRRRSTKAIAPQLITRLQDYLDSAR